MKKLTNTKDNSSRLPSNTRQPFTDQVAMTMSFTIDSGTHFTEREQCPLIISKFINIDKKWISTGSKNKGINIIWTW